MNFHDAQQAADNIRADFSKPGIYPINPAFIAARFGVLVRESSMQTALRLKKQSSHSVFIIVERGYSEDTKRFLLALGLGYYVFLQHRSSEAEQNFDYEFTRSEIDNYLASESLHYAYVFAINLLVPEHNLRLMLEHGCALDNLAEYFGVEKTLIRNCIQPLSVKYNFDHNL